MIEALAFTGHRLDKLGGYKPSAQRCLKALARDVLIENPCELAIVGMALGWDQAVAEACVDLKVPFLAAVPFEGQESRWPAESQKRYRDLLQCAFAVEIVSVASVPVGAAMQLRNQFMVDRCQRLIALWDGSTGGTANCIRYAESKGVPILNTWERYSSNLPADLWGLLS